MESQSKRPRGRPPVDSTTIKITAPVDMIKALDAWRKEKCADQPCRAKAARVLLEIALKSDGYLRW